MKAKEVLNLLHITRPTLSKYVNSGMIKAVKLDNGRYDYDIESVYSIINKGVPRKTCIYARIISAKFKSDLDEQIRVLNDFCCGRGYVVSGVYTDVCDGLSYDNRKGLRELTSEIIAGHVERVIVLNRNRISRVGAETFENMANKYNCAVIAVNDISTDDYDLNEVSDEAVNLLSRYYSGVIDEDTIEVVKDFLDGRVRRFRNMQAAQ